MSTDTLEQDWNFPRKVQEDTDSQTTPELLEYSPEKIKHLKITFAFLIPLS